MFGNFVYLQFQCLNFNLAFDRARRYWCGGAGRRFLIPAISTLRTFSGVAEIENADKIPYIILLHVTSGRFYDTTRDICISETEAKNLTDR